MRLNRLWFLIVVIGATQLGCGQATHAKKDDKPTPGKTQTTGKPTETPAAKSVAVKVDAKHLPNAWRLHDKVISGGQPAGEPAFKELQALGVKTVISVDGAKPDVEAAKKYGLRYVHLPHGYDGISDERTADLAKAVKELPGPIYIHCHHGKHRSPAAATVACVASGLIGHDDALGVLKAAGTSPNYRGLYQAADLAKRIDDKILDERKVDYMEIFPVPAFNEAMVALEHTHDHLKQIAANGWKPTAAHPDIDPAHEALLLREHYTEMLRMDVVKKEAAAYQQIMKDSEKTAGELEAILRIAKKDASPIPPTATAAFDAVTQSCASCHREYRDVPLKEKKSKFDRGDQPF